MTHDEIKKDLKLFITITSAIFILEIIGGFLTNSLALLSDSGHVLVDLLSLFIVFFSMKISRKTATKKYTFGFYRAEIFAAVINAVVLLSLSAFIFYESYTRLLNPEQVKGEQMLVLSFIGLLANLFVVFKMHKDQSTNLNLRGAYLHILGNTLSSIGVIIASILIIVTGNYIFDPLIGSVIAIVIIYGSLRLLKESIYVLMEGTPKHIDTEHLAKDIEKIKGVEEVHDIHVWSLSSENFSMSSHIVVDARNYRMVNDIIARINKMLEAKYRITHSVIQAECEECVVK